jgi:hypothetical protein
LSSQFIPETPETNGDKSTSDSDLFSRTIKVIEKLRKNQQVRMANGAPTDRFCKTCSRFAAIAHARGKLTCPCVCHEVGALLEELKTHVDANE